MIQINQDFQVNYINNIDIVLVDHSLIKKDSKKFK